MKVDRIIAAVRERTPYEAGDLGFALVRHAGCAIWKPWFIVTLPLFVLFNLGSWWFGYPWAAGLLIWWLKPLFDRIPLFVLSRHLFGDTPAVSTTLRAVPRLWRDALPAALLWSRFDLARSFNMPVAQLEGLRGRARLRRQRVLQKSARAPAVWITASCANLIAFFVLSAWTLLLLLVPIEYLPESARAVWTVFVQHTSPAAQIVINLMAYLAVSAVEPFYVAAGFGLYLNRRTQLEAWDVELAFRRLAERLRPAAATAAAVALAVVVLVSVPAAPAQAADAPAAHDQVTFLLPPRLRADADTRIVKAVKAAYKDENLSPKVVEGTWQPRFPKERDNDRSRWNFGGLGALLGQMGTWIVWLAFGGLLLAAIIGLLRYARSPIAASANATPPDADAPVSERAIGLPAQLPDDVPATARNLWRQGDCRGALALLYGGAIQGAVKYGAHMPTGATESQCLSYAEALPEPVRRVFSATVRAWQYLAYAHQPPEAAAFDALTVEWAEAFGSGSRA